MPIARTAVVDHLPAGRAIAIVQSDGEITILFARGRAAEEYSEELESAMVEGIESGRWSQHWSSPVERPPQLRRVS